MTTATAPGKIILFGEHAVVYGRPAIAVPLTRLQATATVEPVGDGLTLVAPDLDRCYDLAAAPPDDPLALVVRATLDRLGVMPTHGLTIRVSSTIPLARGLGSGAAVSTAIVRALAAHFAVALSPDQVSALVYQAEVLYHGTPSGIDNTVIAYEQPVYFVRGQPIEHFTLGAALRLVIADTGVVSPTRIAVGDVRRAWQADPATCEARFDAIGEIVRQARAAIERGDRAEVGRLMFENHRWLQALGVSSAGLDRLVEAAHTAGALGAKLSGGGRGGNAIALVEAATEALVIEALRRAGAVTVLTTEVAR
jgi:mevalonate kinase